MLIPIDEARSLIENMSVSPVRRARLDLMSAVGKVLAEDVIALRDTPERDISAMDGFAFRFSDLQEMKELRIVGKLFPSTRELPTLGRGEAYYITTGAPLPVGADTVARAEFTRVVGNTLTINGPVSRGKDVRQRGEDVKAGELLIPRGTYLTPYHLPILLQQRINEVEVLDISFCIFGNGDEIVPWGSEGDGIPDSIGPAFMKLLERFGRTHYQGIALSLIHI